MRERKRIMDERSDAFLALPGGIGTFEELFEVWTSASLGMHAKPVVVLDPDGHYAPLWAYLTSLRDAGLRAPGRAGPAASAWPTVDGGLRARSSGVSARCAGSGAVLLEAHQLLVLVGDARRRAVQLAEHLLEPPQAAGMLRAQLLGELERGRLGLGRRRDPVQQPDRLPPRPRRPRVR